jgi:hypothetical protein
MLTNLTLGSVLFGTVRLFRHWRVNRRNLNQKRVETCLLVPGQGRELPFETSRPEVRSAKPYQPAVHLTGNRQTLIRLK